MTAGGSRRTCRRDPSTEPKGRQDKRSKGSVGLCIGREKLELSMKRMRRFWLHPVSMQFLLVSWGHQCCFLPVLVTSDLLNNASGNRRYRLAYTERVTLSSAAALELPADAASSQRLVHLTQRLTLRSQAEAELESVK